MPSRGRLGVLIFPGVGRTIGQGYHCWILMNSVRDCDQVGVIPADPFQLALMETKPKPSWDVHLPDGVNETRVLQLLTEGRSGSGVSLRPSG